MKHTFLLLLVLLASTSLWGNNKTAKFNAHKMTTNFFETDWVINKPESYMDYSVKFENEPSRFLSGYYSSALLKNNSINPADSILSIKGYLRIDSLLGEVDITARCWNGSSRKDINHIREFHNIMSSVKPQQWQEFRLDIPVCPQMKEFDFEIRIKGAGCIWIGGLKTEGIKYASPVSPPHSPQHKKQRKTNYQPYYYDGQDLSAVQIENLTTLGKVWGFLKYFHPNVRNGAMDWDAELFRMIPMMMDADAAERNELLLEWCNEQGTFNLSNNTEVLDSNDAVRWTKDTSVLGQGLSLALQKIVMADRTPYHKYLYQEPYIMSIEDKNEKTYPRMSFADINLKLLAAFRVWNYVQYFYPYKSLTDVPWENALEMAVPAMFEAGNKEEYNDVLNAMGVFTNDSHTASGYKPKNFFKLLRVMTKIPSDMKFAAPFITTKYHDGKYFVTWSFGESEQDLSRGDAIIAIDGEDVDDFITREGRLFAASNETRIPRDLAMSVPTSENSSRTYTIIRNNDTLTLAPQMMPFRKFRRELYRSGIRQSTITWFNGRELRAFDTINDTVAYLHAEDMTENDFRKALDYERIIIDLRNYPMSKYPVNNSSLWFMALLPEVKPIATVSYPDLQNPGIFFSMTSDMTGAGRYYNPNRKIVVIADEQTQSSAESAVVLLQSSPQVKVIGSKTSGADGDVVQISLPGEYIFQVGGIGFKYHDGKRIQRCGIRIDYPIDETPDINSDKCIRHALTILK